jgi:hypothetical protein
MISVPWPVITSPGVQPQEGEGRLINVFPEPRDDGSGYIYRRVPGAKIFSVTPSVGAASGSATALGVSMVAAVDGAADGHATATAVSG